jgi:hypothetical protein
MIRERKIAAKVAGNVNRRFTVSGERFWSRVCRRNDTRERDCGNDGTPAMPKR